MSTPSEEEIEDTLFSCRYGELDEVKAFTEQYGWDAIASARDDRGNTAMHMCCGNGHVDILNHLLPHVPSSLLSETNSAGSPPIHWAVLNNHVAIIKVLAEHAPEQGGGLQVFKQKNAAGRDAFREALFAGEGKEEVAGWIEGFLWRVEGGADDAEGAKDGDTDGVTLANGNQFTKEEAEVVDELAAGTEAVRLDDT